MIALTKRQRELFVFIQDYISEHGISPSYAEMRIAINAASKGGIARLVKCLVERGYLLKQGRLPRSIEITQEAKAYSKGYFLPKNVCGRTVLERVKSPVFGGK